jgi:hypothetical protein
MRMWQKRSGEPSRAAASSPGSNLGRIAVWILAGALIVVPTLCVVLLIGLAIYAAFQWGSQGSQPAVTPTPSITAETPVATPVATPVFATPVPTSTIVEATPTPAPTTSPKEIARRMIQEASKTEPWVNSLGMKFVLVADTEVLFSIWDTRVEDFRAFVKESRYDATGEMWALSKDGWTQWGATWESPGFKQGSDHPVVGVSWNDAKAFCAWLTKKEQAAGRLPSEMVYRLPTDEEWSVAVGLSQESGDTPEDKSAKVLGYPWGKQWPPPKGAGNYAGEEARSDWGVIRGYNDGWPCTSPVGSFQANKFGLYDMGGNVAQWCEDWYDSSQTFRVLRGGSWSSGKAEYLLSSDRASNTPENRSANHGFRCVIAAGSAR